MINNEMKDDIYKYFTQEVIDEAIKELEDMEKHPENIKHIIIWKN